MQYQNKKFSVSVGGKKYADGWDRCFGKDADDEVAEVKAQCECEVVCCARCGVSGCVLCERCDCEEG